MSQHDDLKIFTEYEKAFDKWHSSILNLSLIFPSDKNPFRTCLQRDVIRDNEVEEVLKKVWIKTMMEVEDPELFNRIYGDKLCEHCGAKLAKNLGDLEFHKGDCPNLPF